MASRWAADSFMDALWPRTMGLCGAS